MVFSYSTLRLSALATKGAFSYKHNTTQKVKQHSYKHM